MFGSKVGVPVLIAEIEAQIAAGKVPYRGASSRAADAGSVERTGVGIPAPPAELLYSLGMTCDSRALQVWKRMADLITPEPDDFLLELPWPFHYVDAICYGAELLGDAAAVPILQKIHAQPLLHGQSAKQGFQIDFNLEKRALTEVTLARTLARLGDVKGYETLIEYLGDNRGTLAEFAHLALEELTEVNNGKDQNAWTRWLAGVRDGLRPIPLVHRLDG